jgi:hypothetical protein
MMNLYWLCVGTQQEAENDALADYFVVAGSADHAIALFADAVAGGSKTVDVALAFAAKVRVHVLELSADLQHAGMVAWNDSLRDQLFTPYMKAAIRRVEDDS